MGKLASKHFGEIELSNGREHCFVAKHEIGGSQLELDLNVAAHDHFDEAAMRKVDYRLRFLPELVDQVREMISEELDQDGTNPQQFLHFHCSQLKEEQLESVFGVRDKEQLTNNVFLKALNSVMWPSIRASRNVTSSSTSPSARASPTNCW